MIKKKTPPSGKKLRLAIAKEVLEFLDTPLTVAKSTYLGPKDGGVVTVEDLKRFDGDAERLQASILELLPECKVCAKGAMVLAHIKLYDGVAHLPIYVAADNYCDTVIGKVFSEAVEYAFEGRADAGYKWILAYPESKQRLRAIMQNIVKYEGEFRIKVVL